MRLVGARMPGEDRVQVAVLDGDRVHPVADLRTPKPSPTPRSS
jgi:hypothetical protein